MVDAYGAVTWWGFSPAIDLQDEGNLNLNTGKLFPYVTLEMSMRI